VELRKRSRMSWALVGFRGEQCRSCHSGTDTGPLHQVAADKPIIAGHAFAEPSRALNQQAIRPVLRPTVPGRGDVPHDVRHGCFESVVIGLVLCQGSTATRNTKHRQASDRRLVPSGTYHQLRSTRSGKVQTGTWHGEPFGSVQVRPVRIVKSERAPEFDGIDVNRSRTSSSTMASCC